MSTIIVGYYGTRTHEPYCLKCAGLAHEGKPIRKCDPETRCFLCGALIVMWIYLRAFEPDIKDYRIRL